METKRQKIVDKILLSLRAIKIADGYLTDVGASVDEWRDAPLDPRVASQGLIFRDLDEPQELSAPNSRRVKRSLHCLVQVVHVGETPMREIRKVLADIEKAIGTGASTSWDGLAVATRPRIARAVLDQESLKFAGSTFEFYVDYATTAFNSFG